MERATTGTLRAFVAVEAPGEVRAALEQVQDDLKRLGVRARWVRATGMHLTLRFLGEMEAGLVTPAAQALERAAGGQSPFRLQAEGIGVFPDARRPRVIWVGLKGDTVALSQLAAALEEELAAIGFAREKRAFRGHLTLGRFPGPVDRETLAAALAFHAADIHGAFPVEEIVLFQSELRPQGPIYTALGRARLGAAPPG